MDRNKICPNCEIEYLPHIENCADCGTILLLHEEHRRAQEERKQLIAQAIENAVVVRKGDLKWLAELHNILIDAGIPCEIISDAACNKSCCGDKCRLIVSTEDLARAQERIEEYFMEIHPEIRDSNELSNQGKCPACGSPVGNNDNKCSDCGLMFVVIEEENREA
jgi:hypothetical protein